LNRRPQPSDRGFAISDLGYRLQIVERRFPGERIPECHQLGQGAFLHGGFKLA
jgi:hypothetical protein